MEKVSEATGAKTARILAFDMVRVLAMFWVVTYHFGYEYRAFVPVAGADGLSAMTAPILNFFCMTPNFDFGNVAVTMFLMLSGAMLYNKYGRTPVENVPAFYLKRAKSIYPPFWIVNLYVLLTMARHWAAEGTPFFAGNPLKLLLTVTGFDGYARLFGMENYYFCGEWFVGAIVLLYLLFPFLAWAYRKNKIILFVILVICYGLQFLPPGSEKWTISAFPATLCLKFTLGFLLMDLLPFIYRPAVKWISLLFFLSLCLVPIPGGILKNDLPGSVAGIAAFLVVLNFGKGVTAAAPMGRAVAKMAPLAYCVFLIQHIAIVWLQMGFVKVLGRPAAEFCPALCLGLLAITFVLAVVVAYVLNFISGKAVKFVSARCSGK